jgi:hypothetical protein
VNPFAKKIESAQINCAVCDFNIKDGLAKPSLGISLERAVKTVGPALIGPGSLASLFVSVSSGKENPCAAALKIAGEGTPKTTEFGKKSHLSKNFTPAYYIMKYRRQ